MRCFRQRLVRRRPREPRESLSGGTGRGQGAPLGWSSTGMLSSRRPNGRRPSCCAGSVHRHGLAWKQRAICLTPCIQSVMPQCPASPLRRRAFNLAADFRSGGRVRVVELPADEPFTRVGLLRDACSVRTPRLHPIQWNHLLRVQRAPTPSFRP